MPLQQEKLILKAQKIERVLRGLEDKTLTRINKIYAESFRELLKRLPAEYAKLQTGKSTLGILRIKKLLEDLGEYLILLQPDQVAFVEKELQQLYLKASELGLDWANQQFSQITEDTGLKFIKTSLSEKVNIEAAKFAATNSIERLKNYSEDFRVEATNIIALNLTLGIGARKTATQLRQRFEISKSKAETIARTETLAALNDATDYRYQENSIEYVQFIATADLDTCPYCLGRNQSIYKRGEIRLPLHPRDRCFLQAIADLDWLDNGILDKEYSKQYYERSKGDKPATRTKPAPFETIAGIIKAPKAIWEPT